MTSIRLLRIGLVIGLAILLAAIALLFVLDKKSPEYVVTTMTVVIISVFIVLDVLAVVHLERKKRKEGASNLPA